MQARRISGLVLAAGGSRRFGSPKQLAQLDGAHVLEHVLAAMTGVAALDRVVVTLGADADLVLEAIDLHGAQPLVVPDWASGQAASLRAGVAELGADADAIVVALGDQPFLRAETVERVVSAWDGAADAVRATFDGTPGHPVLLARALFPELMTLAGDDGARQILGRHRVVSVACGEEALLDIDTPEDLDAARRQPER